MSQFFNHSRFYLLFAFFDTVVDLANVKVSNNLFTIEFKSRITESGDAETEVVSAKMKNCTAEVWERILM